jgi:multidrug efflux pump subunit AcrB
VDLVKTFAKAGVSVSSNDLEFDPVARSRQFMRAMYVHRSMVSDNTKHFLHPDVVVELSGDPSVFPFAGRHIGIAAAHEAFRAFFRGLVITFGSFRQAAIIGVVAFLSVGLGLLSLRLFAYPIGIVAIIGLLGMMGLAINDSIVVLSDARRAISNGESLVTSVSKSTNHVLTTSITTVAGVCPLIWEGGDFWPPMMIVIAGGVVGATLLALGFTPMMYSLSWDMLPRRLPAVAWPLRRNLFR